MALITPDLSEAKPLEPGEYSARIVEAEITESRNGTPMVVWQLEVFGAEDQTLNGKKIKHRTPIAGKGAFRFREIYEAATGETLGNEAPEIDTDQLMSSEISMLLVEGTDQNGNPSQFPEVKSIRALK